MHKTQSELLAFEALNLAVRHRAPLAVAGKIRHRSVDAILPAFFSAKGPGLAYRLGKGEATPAAVSCSAAFICFLSCIIDVHSWLFVAVRGCSRLLLLRILGGARIQESSLKGPFKRLPKIYLFSESTISAKMEQMLFVRRGA